MKYEDMIQQAIIITDSLNSFLHEDKAISAKNEEGKSEISNEYSARL